jgi:hypothetical protein
MPSKIIIAVAPCDQQYLNIVVQAQYNPKEVSFNKAASWADKEGKAQDFPMVQFTSGQAITLTLELLFDTYEKGGDVRNQITNLMKFVHVIDKTKVPRPPMVQLFWGSDQPLFNGQPFTGIVTSIDTRYTMFRDDGKACRATAKVSLKQAKQVVEGDCGEGESPEAAQDESINNAIKDPVAASNNEYSYPPGPAPATDDGTGSDNPVLLAAEKNNVDLTAGNRR